SSKRDWSSDVCSSDLQHDVAILISKSGETDELVALLQHLKRFGVRTISITGVMESTLARLTDVALDAWVREEACSHDLAPTTSRSEERRVGEGGRGRG